MSKRANEDGEKTMARVRTFDLNLDRSNRDVTGGERLQKIQTDRTHGAVAEVLLAEFLSIKRSLGGVQRVILIEREIRLECQRRRQPLQMRRRRDRWNEKRIRGKFLVDVDDRCIVLVGDDGRDEEEEKKAKHRHRPI